jgi:UPF0755 protein
MTDRLDDTIFGGNVSAGRSADQSAPDQLSTAPRQPTTRRALRESSPPTPSPSRRGRRGVVLLVTLVLVAGAAFGAFKVLGPVLSGLGAAKDYPGPGGGAVAFVIKPGDTGRAIGQRLQDADIVLTSGAFVEAFSANSKAAGIQPGTYQLRTQMRAGDALAALLDPANRSVPRVTVREGLWATEVFAALSKQTGIPVAEYQAAAKQPELIALPEAAKGNLEGYLFPSTYEFASTSTASEQLRTMVRTTLAKLDSLGVSPAEANAVLTTASILEAEARTLEDRRKVARVLLNRLAAKDLLRLDSTVSYAAGRRSVTTTDAERASKSPYNTYVKAGLPPGPIDNPGLTSLQAAIDPADGPWQYFVAVNPETGETRFATSFAQHQVNVAAFQSWCAAHPGKC